MVKMFSALLLAMAAIVQIAYATEVSLNVRPPEPVANESFQLIFEVNGPEDARPDFGELNGIVDVLNKNHRTSIHWVNGRNSRTTEWVLNVIAQQPGKLTIPPVAFGDARSPTKLLEVRAQGTDAHATLNDSNLLLETEVDKLTPYVQEEVILTVRLLRRVELNDANLADPTTDADATIKPLGKDRTYQTNRGGYRYEVFERRYSIFAQSSGKLTIDPVTLTAQIVHGRRLLFDPFNQSVMTKRIQSNKLVLEVKPIPASYTGETWLPARRLRLMEEWTPTELTVEAGEPITRTVLLWADGLHAGQLPEPRVALPDGLKIYPDQPQTSEQVTEHGLNAVRQQKYAIVPTNVPQLIFPETSVTWWNTVSDQMEIARIGQRTLTVKQVASEPPEDVTTAAPGTPSAGLETGDEPAAAPATEPSIDIGARVFAAICLFGWAATAFAWWRRSRRSLSTSVRGQSESPPGLSRARRDVIGACRANDPAATKRALLEWARVAFHHPNITTLAAVGELAGDPLAGEIANLGQALYGNCRRPADLATLQRAFERTDKNPRLARAARSRDPALPEIFRASNR